jgi:L-rhamnose mutarotase
MLALSAVQYFGLTLCLRDDPRKIAEYRQQHAAVWPDVMARLRECGVSEMRIFLLGRRMFMYLETDDTFEPRRDFPKVNEDPVSAEWNRLMAELQERAPEAPPDEWWALMEPVFDLSAQLSRT